MLTKNSYRFRGSFSDLLQYSIFIPVFIPFSPRDFFEEAEHKKAKLFFLLQVHYSPGDFNFRSKKRETIKDIFVQQFSTLPVFSGGPLLNRE